MATLKRWNGTTWEPVGSDTYAPQAALAGKLSTADLDAGVGSRVSARTGDAYAAVADLIDAIDIPLVPNASTNVSAAIKAAFEAAAGRPVRITKKGVYRVSPIVLSVPGTLIINRGVTLKLIDNATPLGTICGIFHVRSSNVNLIVDGCLDGNRSGQNTSTYNTAGGGNAYRMVGVSVAGTSASYLSNINIQLDEVKETVEFAVFGGFIEDYTIRVRSHDTGCGVGITDSRYGTIDARMLRCDNKGFRVYPHVFDLGRSHHVTATAIGYDQFSDDSLDANTSLSTWISGATISNVDDCLLRLVMTTAPDAGQIKGVGISLIAVARTTFEGTRVEGYTDTTLEVGGVVDCVFNGGFLDGRYQKTSSGIVGGTGMVVANYGFYPDYSSRSQRLSSRNVFNNFVVMRMLGAGVDVRLGRYNKFSNFLVMGCQNGVRQRYIALDTEANFTPQLKRDLDHNEYINIDASYNEEHGIQILDGAHTKVVNPRTINNGQVSNYPGGVLRRTTTSSETPTNLSGIYFGTSAAGGLPDKVGMYVSNPEAGDTQTWTDALSGTPVTGKTLSALNPDLYHPGMTVRLLGAGVAGADLITRVDGVDRDEVLLADAPSTFPTVAATGTISSSGKNITGIGTAFIAELNARYWITANGETRQIIKRSSDTDAVVSAAFTTPLAGAAFTISKIVVNSIQSQYVGVYCSLDTRGPTITGGYLVGNIQAAIRDQTDQVNAGNKLRRLLVPGSPTNAANGVNSDGNIRARDSSTVNGKSIIGTVGPASQAGVGLGGTAGTDASDTVLYRQAAGVFRTEHPIQHGNQASSPAAPATGGVLFFRLNGSNKTEYCVRFPTGAVAVLATEP